MPSAVPLRCVLISIALGLVCELVSGRLHIWTYKNRATLVSNVLVMFGVVQGLAIAGLVGGNWPLTDIAPLLFMLGAVVGLIYEGLNEFVVHGWSWSEAPLLGLTRSRDKAAVVGVVWGLAPVAVAVLARAPLLS
jgi:hypothetical protein